MISTLKNYEKRKTKYNILIKKQEKCIKNISILQSFIFVLWLVILIRAYLLRSYLLFYLVLLSIIIKNHKNSKIKNYHFSEYYIGNKIHFDYKLKVGISNTRNAIHLMKLAGIEMKESYKKEV